ncbi:MAG TPA: efflux RND transporter periplasmic adaptor subunit [Gammaproteobacteria bacterium]|nr:efflux RND transporter periplasmic adaptor subunit [Gammaproteobacteria bacterium]
MHSRSRSTRAQGYTGYRPAVAAYSPLLVPALMALAGCTAGEAENAPQAPPAAEVTTAKVLMRDLHSWADFTGRIQAVDTVEVRPRVEGYLESVGFEEGGRVEKGAVLFEIDARPFKAEVDRLRAEREQAKAELGLAESNRKRAERLFAQNATSREELESLESGASVAKAKLAAVEAALESAKLDLGFTKVTAPISGRVSRAVVTPGNLVDSSTLLTTIVSDDPVYVYFDADEHTYLDQVQASAHASGSEGNEGSEGSDVYVGLINEEGYPHAARLDFVDNHVDAEHGTIRARAVLDNPDGRFTPGLFARLRVVGPEVERSALVEDRAIGTDLGRKFVLTVNEQNVAEYRPVETGALVDGLRVVTSGLHEGDVVIVNGLQRVRPGMPVAEKRVAMEGSGKRGLLAAVVEERRPSPAAASAEPAATGPSHAATRTEPAAAHLEPAAQPFESESAPRRAQY